MREPDSAWAATAATNPAVVGQVSVRALAMLLAGEDPGKSVIVPPTLITQKDLNDNDIKNMEELSAKMPQFAHADVAAGIGDGEAREVKAIRLANRTCKPALAQPADANA